MIVIDMLINLINGMNKIQFECVVFSFGFILITFFIIHDDAKEQLVWLWNEMKK